MTFVGPYKILHLDVPGISYEIPPARIVDGRWVRTSPDDYHLEEVREVIRFANETEWTDQVVSAYKRSVEGEVVAAGERPLTDEELDDILRAVDGIKL